MRSISVACLLGVLLGLVAVAPAAAQDDGCGRALAATQGTPGHAWVALHCGQAGSGAGAASGAAAATQGCAQGIAATQGTAAEPYVRAGCARAAAAQNGQGPSDQGPINGCAIAHNETADTPGQAYVDAFCPGATGGTAASPAAVGAQNAAAGCALAIQAVIDTPGEPFVRAGCARAVAQAAESDGSGDGGQGTDGDEEPGTE
jgi:hypothetical protein